MYTTSHRDAVLNTLDSHYCALLKAFTDLRAGTVTEADYTGYGTRPGITFGSCGDTSPAGGRQRTNSAVVTFPQNTGSAQDMVAYAIYSASTGGTMKGWGFLDADPPIWSVVTDISGDVFETAGTHGLSLNQRVVLLANPGAPIPTGVAEDTAYYVGSIPDTESVTLSTTVDNANPVAITAVGGCWIMPYTAVTVATSATPEFAIGAIKVQI